jgi:hypothetical protein
MLSRIELKLVDDQGNYSIAHIEYDGYVEMLVNYDIDMMHDALQAMVNDYVRLGKLDLKRDAVAEHEKFRAPHKY